MMTSSGSTNENSSHKTWTMQPIQFFLHNTHSPLCNERHTHVIDKSRNDCARKKNKMEAHIGQREYQVRWFFWTSCPHIYFVPNPWFQQRNMSLQPQIFPCLQVFPDTDPDFLCPVRWYKGEYWRTLQNIYLTGPKILCHIHHIYMLYVNYICCTQKLDSVCRIHILHVQDIYFARYIHMSHTEYVFCMQTTYFECARYLLCSWNTYVANKVYTLLIEYIFDGREEILDGWSM